MRRRFPFWAKLLVSTVIGAALLIAPAAASAEFGISEFTVEPTTTQAGAHPDLTVDIAFNTVPLDPPVLQGDEAPDESVKTMSVNLPPGLVGNAQNIPQCTELEADEEKCPVGSQVGRLYLDMALIGRQNADFPVYNMAPQAGHAATLGFRVIIPRFAINAGVRTGDDYGINTTIVNMNQLAWLFRTTLKLWGVPADPSHDSERRCEPGESACNPGLTRQPFMRNPTSCTAEPLRASIEASSWQHPGRTVTADAALPAMTGCERLTFEPTISVAPDQNAADSAAGLDVDLQVKRNQNPDGLAAADLKDAVVTLPEGVSVNPSAADGLQACSPSEIGLDSSEAARCPKASKIGKVEVVSPLLEDPLDGSIYQAEQDDNPFNSTLAIYVVAKSSERGVLLKLAGHVEADPETGQLTTTFSDNPQLPFTEFNLHFFGGSRAALTTPRTCGTYLAEGSFTPWSASSSEEPIEASDSFTIDRAPDGGPCEAGDPTKPGNPADLTERPFNPNMNAGLTNPVAGGFSPFVFQLTRQDGEQEILSTTVTPPQGLTAKLAGVPLCSNQQANAGNCPEASQIGEVIAGAGAGPTPFYIQGDNAGKVFMTGSYKGEQLGMLIQVPAKAGPFDLGLINVRAAVAVDKRTAQLTVESDPIPQILEGIPLRTRDIRVLINRDQFTIAPTNCDPMEVNATVQGSHGATANLANRFQVGDCASLGFSPDLDLSFGSAKKNTKANSHPPLNAKLSFNEGDSNISSVEVALPQGLFLDQDRLGRICSRANYAAETCPAESQVGYAKAQTPLLDDPVEGPVYLKASDNPLPDLAADLNGQIDVDLFGKIDQKQNKKGLNQIRNTFDIVPDVPVSDFELKLDGGSDGLLVNSRNICKSKKAQKVSIDMVAHNEMTLSERPLIGSACKSINKKKAKKLKAKAKKLLRKAKKADNARKAKKLRKQARKLKRQARKLGR